MHGNAREEALSRMGQALDSFILEGVTTTIPFLARVIRHPGLRGGQGRHQVPRAGIPPAPARDMRIDVAFTPAGLTQAEVHGRAVFVIDILRATTTMCAALSHGARAIIPVASTEEALRLAQTIGSADVLLAGERNCIRIPGFHLGNSPLEMTESAVRGKTIILTTTNGTDALLACQAAGQVYPAAAANLPLRPSGARGAGGAISRPDRLRRPERRLRARRCLLRRPARWPRSSGPPSPAASSTTPGWPVSTWSAATATAGSARCAYSRAGRELVRLGFRRRRARCGPARRLSGPGAVPRAPGHARSGSRMSTDSRRRLGAVTALVLGLFVGLTLLPLPITGPVGRYLGHGLWQMLGAGALGIPLLGVGLALAGFDRLGELDMKRSAMLIIGLSLLVPYLIGVLTGVGRARPRSRCRPARIRRRGSSACCPGSLPRPSRARSGVAGAVLLGFPGALRADPGHVRLASACSGWRRRGSRERGTGQGREPDERRAAEDAEASGRRPASPERRPTAPSDRPSVRPSPSRGQRKEKGEEQARSRRLPPRWTKNPDLPPDRPAHVRPSQQDVDAGEAQLDRLGQSLIETLRTFKVEGRARPAHHRPGRDPVRGGARRRASRPDGSAPWPTTSPSPCGSRRSGSRRFRARARWGSRSPTRPRGS